ncbi:MAG TPA: SUMF1/EgtB/PvdO family nonheme iron enzyme, partial [Nitrospirota bacterium]|nr:SUMF1/EgtB/PvdO family nonheme iron enzyme [Nitrospirota bacterium]
MSFKNIGIALLCLITAIPAFINAETLDLDSTTGMEFVFIKGGCYEMGDSVGDGDANERPVHTVCINDFSIGKFEVTNAQFRKFRPQHDSGKYEGIPLNDDVQPVVNVS